MKAYHEMMPGSDRKEVSGNLMARIRMTFCTPRYWTGAWSWERGTSRAIDGLFYQIWDGGADLLPIGTSTRRSAGTGQIDRCTGPDHRKGTIRWTVGGPDGRVGDGHSL